MSKNKTTPNRFEQCIFGLACVRVRLSVCLSVYAILIESAAIVKSMWVWVNNFVASAFIFSAYSARSDRKWKFDTGQWSHGRKK